MTDEELQLLTASLAQLTSSQKALVKTVTEQFGLTHIFCREPSSDIITEQALEAIGDVLRMHHVISRQPLSKDRFEFAFERALLLSGIPARLEVSRTNPGHDITIAGVPVSLKTEASKGIKRDFLHISKFMELGSGEWILERLRDQFFEHMKNYDRIFQLRCLVAQPTHYFYELIEIPKALLLEAANCEFQTMVKSRQVPKPGYGYVYGESRRLKYSLYFDGGTERKLQIKRLRKELCVIHATWDFDSTALG